MRTGLTLAFFHFFEIGDLSDHHIPHFIHFVALRITVAMPCLVTFPAQAHKVVEVEADARIVYILRCQLDDVVNLFRRCDDAGTHTVHTQIPVTPYCCLSNDLPLSAFIKLLRVVFHCYQKSRS